MARYATSASSRPDALFTSTRTRVDRRRCSIALTVAYASASAANSGVVTTITSAGYIGSSGESRAAAGASSNTNSYAEAVAAN